MISLSSLRLDTYFDASQLSVLLILAIPIIYFLYPSSSPRTAVAKAADEEKERDEPQTIMQPENPDLAPPKDDPFTQEQLKAYDGSDETKPIYVAIKGTVFDVTRKGDVYGKGKSYNVFAGKDGSRGLGMSSLKLEDAVPDYSTLDEKDRKTLDEWHSFFSKRYNIVGKVVDIPALERARV